MEPYSLQNIPILDPNYLPPENPWDTFGAHPKGKAWFKEMGFGPEDYPSFETAINRMDPEDLVDIFGFEGATYLWAESRYFSDLGRWFEKNHPFLAKTDNCLWRYGCAQSYRHLAESCEKIRALSTGSPDFTLSLTWTTGCNEQGYSEHLYGSVKHLYLDAPFGLLVNYKGKHVLTIGFAVSKYGVFIPQVQLREKHGNRWLYKLPKGYLEWSLDLLANAFSEKTLYLPTGESVVLAVKKSYGPGECVLTPEDEARIVGFYNSPLKGFKRLQQTENNTYYRRNFIPLDRTEGVPQCTG